MVIPSGLLPPAIFGHTVDRPRLVEQLQAQPSGTTSLIIAPAGWGKTTLMAMYYEWLKGRGIRAAWLSLKAEDQGVSSLLPKLMESCALAGFPGFNAVKPADFGPQDESSLQRWIEDRFAALTDNQYLFVDDYQCALSSDSSRVINELLHLRIPALSIVLASRELPEDLAVADLRLEGRLFELDSTALAFSELEADSCRRQLAGDQSVSQSWCAEVTERASGWPAAVALACRWLSQGSDEAEVIRRLTGRSPGLYDYFDEQVFGPLPIDLQTALLSTSILRQFCGGLLARMTSDTNGWRLLSALRRRDLFLSTLNLEEGWCAYYPLFREYLTERAHRDCGIKIDQLHSVAASWFNEQGLLPQAVHHALAAGDGVRVAQILEALGGWQYALQSDTALVESALEQVATEWLPDYPRLWLARVFLSVRIGHHRAAAEDLTGFESTLAERLTDDETLRAEYILIRTVCERYSDEPVTDERVGVIELLALPPDNFVLRAVRANFLCAMYRERSDYGSAYLHGEEALQRYDSIGARHQCAFIHYHLGLCELRQARFHAAESQYRRGLGLAAEQQGRASDLVAIGEVFLAQCLFETQRFEAAEGLLEHALPHVERADAWLEVYYAGYSTLLRAAGLAGDALAADRIMSRAQVVANTRQLPRLMTLLRLQRHLLNDGGHLASTVSGRELEIDTELAWDPECEMLLALYSAHNLCGRGEQNQALQFLSTAIQRAQSLGSFRAFVWLSAQAAALYKRQGEGQAALETLESAISVAIIEDYRLAFVEAPQELGELLSEILTGSTSAGAAPVRLAFIRKVWSDVQSQQKLALADDQAITCREAELLHCLRMGKSNREIAEDLSISANTVKFHLKNIFCKLGAASRDEAVARAMRAKVL